MRKTANISEFQARVYEATKKIPLGRVITYAGLAGNIGCGSPRAVGQALKKNPFAPKVPCHRVISSDLTVGGFQGKKHGSSINKKMRLLKEEGVEFNVGRLADLNRLWQG